MFGLPLPVLAREFNLHYERALKEGKIHEPDPIR
jgi:hypothetical protein